MRGLIVAGLALSVGASVCGAQQSGQVAPPGYFLPGAPYERPKYELAPVSGRGIYLVYGNQRLPTMPVPRSVRPAPRYFPIRMPALPGRRWYLRVRPQAPRMLRR